VNDREVTLVGHVTVTTWQMYSRTPKV